MLNTLKRFIESQSKPTRLVIAYSGGVDSHVLLHAFKQLHQADSTIFSLRAIHIHHGLNSKASQWQQHAQHICDVLDIPLNIGVLNLNIQKGDSIEAAARAARYAYFANHLMPDEILCTAHHQNDQLETVLLQLLRGAGPKGLSAMPSQEKFAKGILARPLLEVSHDLILKYAQEYQLDYREDESNANVQFDRNFLRHEIIPVLKKRYPQAAQTVSRSAMHCASTQAVLEDYLQQELVQLEGDFPNTLSRKKLLGFDANTQSHLLRTWLQARNIPMPSTQQLKGIQKLLGMKNDVKAIITWQDYSARLYRDSLFAEKTEAFHPSRLVMDMSLLSTELLDKDIQIQFYEKGQGLHLKKVFQSLNIPPWQRSSIPLIYTKQKLTAIFDPTQKTIKMLKPHE